MKIDFKNKKHLMILGGAAVALIVIIIVIVSMLSSNKAAEEKASLDKSLNDLGKKFYEEQYYTGLEDKGNLKNFKDTGLNISITNLDLILPLDKETKALLDDRKCDYDQTKIIIYPKDPYKATDYSLKVELSCEEE